MDSREPLGGGVAWGERQQEAHEVLAVNPTTVAEFADQLGRLQSLLDDSSPRGEANSISAFNNLYHVITREVLATMGDGATDGRRFTDDEFLNRLDIEFGRRYLDALRSWTSSEEATPRCWALLFSRRDEEVAPLLSAVLGVNAHINYDLAFALVETFRALGVEPPPDGHPWHDDYLLVNDIFHLRIPDIRRELMADSWWKLKFDRLNGRLDDWVQGNAVVFTRDRAWAEARGIWPVRHSAGAYAEKEAALDETASALAGVVLSDFAERFFG